MRATRIDALWQVVDRERVQIDDQDFLWPISIALGEFTGFRADVLRYLSIDQLHPQELMNVMSAAVSRSRSSDQETRMREALTLMGGGRMTEGVRSALLRAYQDATSHQPLRSAQAPSVELPPAARSSTTASGPSPKQEHSIHQCALGKYPPSRGAEVVLGSIRRLSPGDYGAAIPSNRIHASG